MCIPNPGFFPIPNPDHESRGQKSNGSRIQEPGSKIQIRNNIFDKTGNHVLRICDVYPGSRIQGQKDPCSGYASKNLSIF